MISSPPITTCTQIMNNCTMYILLGDLLVTCILFLGSISNHSNSDLKGHAQYLMFRNQSRWWGKGVGDLIYCYTEAPDCQGLVVLIFMIFKGGGWIYTWFAEKQRIYFQNSVDWRWEQLQAWWKSSRSDYVLMTCLLLVCDLFMSGSKYFFTTYSRPVQNLFTTCSQLDPDSFMTCSWLVHY